MDFSSTQIDFDDARERRLEYLALQSPTAQDYHPLCYEPSYPFEGAVYPPAISPSRQIDGEEGGNIDPGSQNNHSGSWSNNPVATESACSHTSQGSVVASYGITGTFHGVVNASTASSSYNFQSSEWIAYNGGVDVHHESPTASLSIPRSVALGSCPNAYAHTSPGDSVASDVPSLATIPHMLKSVVASDSVYDASKRRRKPGRKAWHRCPICKRTFTAPHNLQNHINSHFGIKRYGCQFCDARSNTRSDMTRHEKKCKARPYVGPPNSS
ncbi:hypothetical protein Moror_3950 [Moniliophthora roreri MCA 2997]|uniref:C2H2-type domain-containing protein n=1 Tax=Moniliophthora roreri (strain MCA 2997) TaxID=1381753 RepID=V2XRX6_MONRO|nr:hypothetical protein Moror_3950 [Moniliophthora roreri MCA 2997]